MEETGVIRKYTIVIDEDIIGKPITKLVMIRAKPDKIEDVCERLVEIDEVYGVHEILERYNVLVKLRAHDVDEVRNVLTQKILTIPDIVESDVLTVYKTWKEDLGVGIEQCGN